MDAPDARPTVTTAPPRPAVAPTPSPERRPRRRVSPIAFILAASLAVRLALWAAYVAGSNPAALLRDDAKQYHDSARALLHTGTFSVAPEPPLFPQTLRTPGYPSFIAAVYALFGERPDAAVLVQAILSVATIGLAYALARRLWGERVALLAAALLALSIASLLYSLLLLTESLFTLVLMGALACGVAVLTRPDRRRWAAALGLMLAACCMVRPAAYYLVVPVALGLLVHGWRARWGAREVAWTLALLLVPYGAVVGGWQYRNYRVSGSAAFSQVDATVLLFYRGAAIMARRDGIGLDEARARLSATYGAAWDDPRATGDNARRRRAGIALIRENPGIYARVVAIGVARTLVVPAGFLPPTANPPPPEPGWRAELGERGPWGAVRARIARRGLLHTATFALDALLLVATLAGAAFCVGALGVRRRISVTDVFLLGVAAYMILIHAGPSAGVRTRVAVAPILAMYAARGLIGLWARIRPIPAQA